MTDERQAAVREHRDDVADGVGNQSAPVVTRSVVDRHCHVAAVIVIVGVARVDKDRLDSDENGHETDAEDAAFSKNNITSWLKQSIEKSLNKS